MNRQEFEHIVRATASIIKAKMNSNSGTSPLKSMVGYFRVITAAQQ